MFDFTPDRSASAHLSKAELYRQLGQAAEALIAGESDGVANMANVAALMWEFIPDLNWAGFYRVMDGALVLGPFIGRPACVRIPLGQGVCGTAVSKAQTQLVEDVHAFPGHIACDSASNSELVVPIIRDKETVAVIDLDSPTRARFDADDAAGIEQLAKTLSAAI